MHSPVRRPLVAPLVPLYRAALAAKNRLRDGGFGVRSLARPVVSVGSLSAGGAGKTPVVLALAELLARHGIACDVLSRGYGRAAKEVEQVDANGSAERFGDEPLELAQAGLRVFVGSSRFGAGQLAETAFPAGLHLLDDGFGHRTLARALDLALLTREDTSDTLLPGGNLREPLQSLGRADAVLLRAEEADTLRPVVNRFTSAPVWLLRRNLLLPASLSPRPLAFCGLARPQGFYRTLEAAGVSLAGCFSFQDHHRYTVRDAEALVQRARQTRADSFVVTAKDAVKLTPRLHSLLERIGPLHVAQLRASFVDEAPVLAALRSLPVPPPGTHEKMGH